MLKILLVIQLLIGLTKQSLPDKSSELAYKKVCNSFVSLDRNQYIIKGRSIETVNCNFESVGKCPFNKHKVSVQLMVDGKRHSFGSVDCKRQAFDLRQDTCFMKILLGIEDLGANNFTGDRQLNVSCIASFDTSDGLIAGESSNSSLKVFAGESLNSVCSESKPCMSNRNITCINNICRCESDQFARYFDEYDIASCAPTAKHNQQCFNSQQCKEYNSRCTQTSIGKLCQCIDGYYWTGYECKDSLESRQFPCPSCECNQISCVNEWTFKLNVLIFVSGMIAGVFAFKTCLCCIKNKRTGQTLASEGPRQKSLCVSLDTKELANQFNEKISHKFESMRSSDKSEDLESVRTKY